MTTNAAEPLVVAMGELLIDFMGKPSGKPLSEASEFVRKPGGAPANVAVGVRRLGLPSAFIGMVGQDAFGDFLRGVLESESVDVRGLATCTSQPTTLAFVAMDAKGVPSFSFYRHPGADLSITPEEVNTSVLERAQVFHFGSLSLVAEPAREATRFALREARERGAFVTYDPNYRPALWPSKEAAREQMAAPLDQVDLVKISEEELLLITGASDLPAGLEAMAALGPRTIVVTRGGEGLTGWHGGERVDVPGESVEVVDTTGCGDASMAAVITALLRLSGGLQHGEAFDRERLEQALRFANACAAKTATRLGAIPALPHADEVEGLLGK